jgi:hypothetical protein
MGSEGRVWFAGLVGGELRLATGHGLGPFSVERVSLVPSGWGISSLRLVVQGSTARLAWVATSGQLTGMRIESTTCSVARCATQQILQSLSVQGNNAGSEEVALASSGRSTIAIWDDYQSSVGNPSLWWALSSGARFARSRAVGAHGSDPALVGAPSGHIFAGWASNGAGSLTIREWTGGSRLRSAPTPEGSSSGQRPQLVIAGDALSVAWGADLDGFGASSGVLPSGPLSVATLPLGARRFQATQTVSSDARDFTLAGTPDGRLALAFGQVRPGMAGQDPSEEAAVATRAPGASFATPTILETDPPEVDVGPAATITSAGTVAVEWYTGGYLSGDIQAATVQAGAAPSPPFDLGVGTGSLAAASYGTTAILTWAGSTAYQAQIGSAP